ncbi:molybdopterin synthase catalytic subunit [Anastrepha obliqua]|uniref:molybdopterin synthase catalytic subunit n=1 Tax=Anastrepha obliqua TaxID=95512 RepID=UPI002409D3D8|nr:molybdopterin synthase catalytic subunit [Anastrepha obliqua]
MANFLVITRETLDVGAISTLVANEKCGAISLFVGTTRDSFEGKNVHFLEYEAYESMAKKELQKLCDTLRSRWQDVLNIAIYHRLGLVAPKEASVVIAISSPHRQDSLDAVSYAIDELKKKVPIWKKELYHNGDSDWKQNKELYGNYIEKGKFNISKAKLHTEISVPKELVQITAEESEIWNRVVCFLKKKRKEIDQGNIIDYVNTGRLSKIKEESVQSCILGDTCARVSSTIVKQDSSKCLLKVSRVKNIIGPQTRPNYFKTLDKLIAHEPSMHLNFKKKEKSGKCKNISTAACKRLEAMEQHLFYSPKNYLPINVRLKQIEDKILHLESISPEYWHFMVDANNSPTTSGKRTTSMPDKAMTNVNYKSSVNYKAYTVEELVLLMQQLHNCKYKEGFK